MKCLWEILFRVADGNEEEEEEVERPPSIFNSITTTNGRSQPQFATNSPPIHPREQFLLEYNRVASNDPDIKELSLWDVEMIRKHLPLVKNAFLQNSCIQVMEFSSLGSSSSSSSSFVSDHRMTTGSSSSSILQELFDLEIRSLPISIREIIFRKTRFHTGDDIYHLLHGISFLPSLRIIELSDGSINDDILKKVASIDRGGGGGCPNLEEIRLPRNGLTDEGFFGNFIHCLIGGGKRTQSCRALKSLIADGNHFLHTDTLLDALGDDGLLCSTIEILDLSNSPVDLMTILEGFPSLSKLTLNSCKNRSGRLDHNHHHTILRHPFDVRRCSPTLKHLSLRRCGLCNSDATDLVRILLLLPHSDCWKDYHRDSDPRLDILDLESNMIDERWLTEAISSHPLPCKILNVRSCQIRHGDSILASLFESHYTMNLQRIDLGGNPIRLTHQRDIEYWMKLNEFGLAPKTIQTSSSSLVHTSLWEMRRYGIEKITQADILFHWFSHRPDYAMRVKLDLEGINPF